MSLEPETDRERSLIYVTHALDNYELAVWTYQNNPSPENLAVYQHHRGTLFLALLRQIFPIESLSE